MKYLTIVAITMLLTASTIYQLRNITADLSQYFASRLERSAENDSQVAVSGDSTNIATVLENRGSPESVVQKQLLRGRQTFESDSAGAFSVGQLD